MFSGTLDPLLITQIAKGSQPGAIPDLLPLVFNKNADVANAAVSALYDLVALVPPSRRAAMDGLIREVGEGWRGYGSPWYKMKPEDVTILESFGPRTRCCLLGLATSHSNGYVRERAICLLDSETSGSELPFMIVRLNDWVYPVRAAALRLLRKRLRPEYAAHFVNNLSLVQRLISCGRSDHADFVGSVRTLLSAPDCRSHLLSGMNSEDVEARRLCYRWAVLAGAVADEGILQAALHDKDVLVRLWAAKTIRTLSSPRKRELVKQMSHHRFMPVRREALYFWAEQADDESETELRKTLLDPSRAMRESARFYVHRRTQVDFASLYRSQIGEGYASAILGLGETGTVADADLLEPFLAHSSAQVLKATLSSLNRLDGENRVPKIFPFVAHLHPGVSMAATTALLDKASQIETDQIWRLLVSNGPMHVRLNALKLIDHKDQWTKLPLLIESIAMLKSPVQTQAQKRLEIWLKQYNYMVKPSGPEQVREILKSLGDHSKILDAALVNRLRWILKDY